MSIRTVAEKASTPNFLTKRGFINTKSILNFLLFSTLANGILLVIVSYGELSLCSKIKKFLKGIPIFKVQKEVLKILYI